MIVRVVSTSTISIINWKVGESAQGLCTGCYDTQQNSMKRLDVGNKA